jgi:hypothetical protein
MATHFCFGDAGDASKGGGIIPAIIAAGVVSETITASGSNQQTTATAPALGNRPVCLVSTDAAVYVAFGTNPNALTGTTQRFFLPAGTILGFIVKTGDKAAVVTA